MMRFKVRIRVASEAIKSTLKKRTLDISNRLDVKSIRRILVWFYSVMCMDGISRSLLDSWKEISQGGYRLPGWRRDRGGCGRGIPIE